jgi:metal-sulfur cluster biosynthetic enzyme
VQDGPETVLPNGRHATTIQDGQQELPLSLGGMATGTATEEDIYEALEEVIDPELGLDFVSLGLVYDVEIEDDEAYITFTLTTPACPIGPQVSEQMREFVGQLQGIDKVHPKMVFDPPWSPEMMSEDAKFALGY